MPALRNLNRHRLKPNPQPPHRPKPGKGRPAGARCQEYLADAERGRLANHASFSLHAGVMAEAHQHDKLERLCRYISRPAVSEKPLALAANEQVRYELKTPYRNGTTHVIFEPLDFIAKLVALIPKPRVNLTRFHGVFASNSQHRVQVTPAKRGK